jgi:hypothetical protein
MKELSGAMETPATQMKDPSRGGKDPGSIEVDRAHEMKALPTSRRFLLVARRHRARRVVLLVRGLLHLPPLRLDLGDVLAD